MMLSLEPTTFQLGGKFLNTTASQTHFFHRTSTSLPEISKVHYHDFHLLIHLLIHFFTYIFLWILIEIFMKIFSFSFEYLTGAASFNQPAIKLHNTKGLAFLFTVFLLISGIGLKCNTKFNLPLSFNMNW